MLTIRPAVHKDAYSMMCVHRDAILSKASHFYPQATLDAWAKGATPDRVARVGQEIADPDFIVLVAEVETEVIGFAMAIPPKAELRAVYVKPNLIGNVGRTLLAKIEKLAFTDTEFLACDASLNAVFFYKANGYTEESRCDHRLSTGEKVACVRMRKTRPI